MVVLFCSLALNNANAAAIDSLVLHNIIGNHQINTQLETEKFVWVTTNDGLFLINKKQLTYRVFDPENSIIPSYHITALCSTSNGQVLIGTDNGLVRYDNFTFILLNTENTNLPSNNIVKIVPIGTNNIANVFVANTSVLKFYYGAGNTDFVTSLVIGVNQAANTVTLKDNVWTYVANVLTATANNGNNQVLNITTLNTVNTYFAYSSTGTGNTSLVWDFINNGNYSNTMYPLSDIVHVGDVLYVNGVSQTVSSVDPIHGIITLSAALGSGANGLVSIGRNLASTFGNTFVYTPK